LCDSGLRREVGLESLFFKDLDLDLECEDLDLDLDLLLKDFNDIYKLRPPTVTSPAHLHLQRAVTVVAASCRRIYANDDIEFGRRPLCDSTARSKLTYLLNVVGARHVTNLVQSLCLFCQGAQRWVHLQSVGESSDEISTLYRRLMLFLRSIYLYSFLRRSVYLQISYS